MLFADVLQTAAYQRDISRDLLKVNIDPAAAYVIADSTQFTRALGNILQNAVESGAKTVKVTARPAVERGMLEIIIEDDGEGMDQDASQKAWSPFYSTRGLPHHGLGLPAAMHVISQSQGHIALVSDKGRGTTVDIVMPGTRVDYDLWLGPAPWAPYTTARLRHPHWFHISDDSLGYVSGWGIHDIDSAQWGNGTELTGPIEIEGSARFPDDDALCDNPLNWEVRMKYANGVDLIFTGHGAGFTGVREGVTFEGPDGWVWVNRGAIEAEPKSLLQEPIHPNGVRLPVSISHQANFLECIRSRQKTICHIDVAARSDMVCQLAWCAFPRRA